MWKNTVHQDRPQITILRMRTASWIPKTTDTNSEYVIFIAFSTATWLCERALILRYTYIACLIHSNFHGSTALVCQGMPLIIEASRTHSVTPHSVGLLWTCDRPLGVTSTQQPTTLNTRPCLRPDSKSPTQQ